MSDSDGESQLEQNPNLAELEGSNENKPPASSENKVPKHLRLRYWNAWEEMRLIELWRQHSADITTLQKNTPVFRTIMEGMREYGFQVNSQECRRKINTLKNKYIAERRRIESSDNQRPSDWRLYPLIHCLLSPKQKNPDLTHQLKVLNALSAKVPDLHACSASPVNAHELAPMPANGMSPGFIQLQPQQLPPYSRRRSSATHNVLKHHFTVERLTQLRADNQQLTAQRDSASQQLLAEEQEYKLLESFLTQWQHQQVNLLQSLQCSSAN